MKKLKKLRLVLIPTFVISQKNPSINIWVPKMRFTKVYIFWPQIESEGPGMVSLLGLLGRLRAPGRFAMA